MLEANLRIIFDKILSKFEAVGGKVPDEHLTHEGIPLKWFDWTSCSACYSMCFVYELPTGEFKVRVDHGGVERQGGGYISHIDEHVCTTLKEVYDVLMSERQLDGNTTSDHMDALEHCLAIGEMNKSKIIAYQDHGFEHLGDDIFVDYRYPHEHTRGTRYDGCTTVKRYDYENKHIYKDGKTFLETLGDLTPEDIDAVFDRYFEVKPAVVEDDAEDEDD